MRSDILSKAYSDPITIQAACDIDKPFIESSISEDEIKQANGHLRMRLGTRRDEER